MQTKNFFLKKATHLLFGERYYHSIKFIKILLDYYMGKDYDDIYAFTTKLLKQDAVVLDIGANMGQYLCRLSKILKEATIVSIDPVPVNASALKLMKRILKIDNAIISDLAISTAEGTLTMHIPRLNGVPIATQAKLKNIKCETSDGDEIEVATTRLDDLVNSLGLEKVDFIKVDTEGHDFEVLKSGINTIKKHKPLIRVESNFQKEELQWLNNIGYFPFKIVNSKIAPINSTADALSYKGDTYFAIEDMFSEIVDMHELYNNYA